MLCLPHGLFAGITDLMNPHHELIACRECDFVQRRVDSPVITTAPRCVLLP
jgi:hypothetical protein